MELAFAGLHQLCAPMLDLLDGLPAPQRDALRTAFGISAGPPPDRFLVALAVLSLLSDVADERPLLCLVDDEQWLDQASAQVLAFVARRLVAESVAIVFAARVPSSHLLGLPELVVSGLAKADARALLDRVLTAPLDAQVRDQIVAETHGNPLALVELPRGLTALELAGGFGLPDAGRFAGSIEESFRRRLDALPEQTRRLLLLAAVETAGDSALVWRAAALLGIDADAAGPAAEADLAELGARVRFRHPWCVRRRTGRRRFRTGNACITHWRRSPTPNWTPTDAPGTGPTPRQDPMRRSPPNSSVRPAGRRRGADLPPRRHSWSAPRC